jgi:hypothetical protein
MLPRWCLLNTKDSSRPLPMSSIWDSLKHSKLVSRRTRIWLVCQVFLMPWPVYHSKLCPIVDKLIIRITWMSSTRNIVGSTRIKPLSGWKENTLLVMSNLREVSITSGHILGNYCTLKMIKRDHSRLYLHWVCAKRRLKRNVHFCFRTLKIFHLIWTNLLT